MVDQKGNQLVKGALLLTLAGLVSKVLSAGYRIPLQNLTGDIGFYIYQQVYPILGMAMTFALYGFPQAISKITVEMQKYGKALSFTHFYVPVFAILLFINGTFFLLLRFIADDLGNWIGDPNLITLYEYASFIFLLVPFTSLLRGVFQGDLHMKPTAYSQIGEQFIRVFFIIIAAILVSNHILDLYDLGKAAVLASLIGAITAIIILISFFIPRKKPSKKETYIIPWNYYVRTILILGVVASLNHMILLGIQLVDAFTLVPGLEKFGIAKLDAMELKGVFDRGQPLIQLGTVLGSSFALAFIPSISSEKLRNEKNEFYFYIRTALMFSFYLAIAATIGLIILFSKVNTLLFTDDKGTFVLQILVLSIFLCSISITASSILQGLGYIKRTAVFILTVFILKWVLNDHFLSQVGLIGGSISTVISLLALTVFVFLDLKQKLPQLSLFRNIRWRALILSSMAMIIYLVLIDLLVPNQLLATRLSLFFYVIFLVITGACIFIIGLLRGNAFTERQLNLLPYASFFIRISRGGKKSCQQ